MAELLSKALKFVKEYKIVILLGVVALLIGLLQFARSNPGKIPFLDPLVEKIFGGGGGNNENEEKSGTLFHTMQCNACGRNWCTNYELNEPNILQNENYTNSGKTLQDRGCDGVTSAWRSVRDSVTGEVYATTP